MGESQPKSASGGDFSSTFYSILNAHASNKFRIIAKTLLNNILSIEYLFDEFLLFHTRYGVFLLVEQFCRYLKAFSDSFRPLLRQLFGLLDLFFGLGWICFDLYGHLQKNDQLMAWMVDTQKKLVDTASSRLV